MQRVGRSELVSAHDRAVSVAFDEDGNLVFDGADFGPRVEQLFWRDEFEFRYLVPEPYVVTFAGVVGIDPQDPIRGLAENWKGDARFTELGALMRSTAYIEYSSY